MDSQWLKTQFTLHPRKSKTGLARALGLEPSAISKILKGGRQIKAQEYAVMRRYFGLPVDGDNAARKKGGPSYIIEPLAPANQLKDKGGESQDGEWVIPADILDQRTKAAAGEVKIFKVTENAMEPDFRRGEPVLVDLSDVKPSPPGIFIVSDGFGYLVRQCEYVPGSNPPEIQISAKDKSFKPQTLRREEFRIIGRVIAKLLWL